MTQSMHGTWRCAVSGSMPVPRYSRGGGRVARRAAGFWRGSGAGGGDVQRRDVAVVFTDRGEARRIILRVWQTGGAQGEQAREGGMATTRMTLAQITARGVGLDAARLAATTEAEIRRQMVEDGQDPDAGPPAGRLGALPATIRRRLGMTQAQFAAVIGVPVATLRNWEQARVEPDPAARALLRILDQEPEAALRALGRGVA